MLLAKLIDQLEQTAPGGYHPGSQPASEPAAWAAMALASAGREHAARRCADWLVEIQGSHGAVGVNAEQPTPAWPTSLALLAWLSISPEEYQSSINRAVDWALEAKGRTTERKPQIGHNTTLVGWSWAADTHSWLEPTAMFIVALRAAGHGGHPRVREGVRLLVDRLLPGGGANYGNTLVLGQELVPHVQPTGLVLWALAGEEVTDPRLERAIEYLSKSLGPRTTPASLAFGLLGLTAQGRRPVDADRWIDAAADRQLAGAASPYKLALLAAARTTPAAQLANADA